MEIKTSTKTTYTHTSKNFVVNTWSYDNYISIQSKDGLTNSLMIKIDQFPELVALLDLVIEDKK